MDKGTTFKPGLESLRGIAALTVAVHHGMSAFVETATIPQRLVREGLMPLFSPNPAVIIFFVLSGYVLGESLERNGDYIPFIIRRFFRIIPPFVLSVLFAYVCLSTVRLDDRTSANVTGFFHSLFWPEPSLAMLRENLVLISTRINGPTWSILPEILGSLILPFFVFAHRLAGPRYRWQTFVAITALMLLSRGRFALFFYFGYFLSIEVSRLVSRRWWLALICAIAGYTILWLYEYQQINSAAGLVTPTAIGAALLIGSLASSRDFARWLEVAPLRFLGRISYSFYLLHWPLFYLTAAFVALHTDIFSPGFTANVETGAISIVLSLIAATISYRYVEVPCIAAGKRLAERANIELEFITSKQRT
jgi:peptidoglycan/LPS O-acetylase OafA/YrhL